MSSADNEVAVVDDSPKLEIVPPSENSAADSAYGEEDSVESGSASTSVAALQEELARKEEALITEQQTNEYLQERIKELESQVAGEDDAGLTVEDEELAGMESRLREQRLDETAAEEDAATPSEVPQITTSSVDKGKPWYGHWVTWLIAALVLVAGGFGWYRNRIASEGVEFDLDAANEDTVRGIKDEAEEILKVLDPDEHPESAGTPGDGPASEDAAEQGDQPGDEDKVDSDSKPTQKAKAKQFDTEEAAVLDEDSADPEVRLDLARAYISMGDREAARAILGEVIEHGNESQRAEAQSMLDEM
jgi:FimV-like protein